MADMPAIHIRDLVVGFGEKIILDHLDLDVNDGEILGLVGASGGGKSVLMRTLVGRFRSGAGRSISRATAMTNTAGACCSSRERCSRP